MTMKIRSVSHLTLNSFTTEVTEPFSGIWVRFARWSRDRAVSRANQRLYGRRHTDRNGEQKEKRHKLAQIVGQRTCKNDLLTHARVPTQTTFVFLCCQQK